MTFILESKLKYFTSSKTNNVAEVLNRFFNEDNFESDKCYPSKMEKKNKKCDCIYLTVSSGFIDSLYVNIYHSLITLFGNKAK